MPTDLIVLPGDPIFKPLERYRKELEFRGFDIRGLLQYCFYAPGGEIGYSKLAADLARDLIDVDHQLIVGGAELNALVHRCIDITVQLRQNLSHLLLRYFGHTDLTRFRFHGFLGRDIALLRDSFVHDHRHDPTFQNTGGGSTLQSATARTPNRLWHRAAIHAPPLVGSR